MRAIGLMSGTSLDGIDAALVEIEPRGERLEVRSLRFETVPFTRELQARLRAALPPHDAPPALASELDRELGTLLADAAQRVAAGESVDFVASHGLTLFHRGEARETLQIGNPYRVRDALEASVVFDFRRADCAAGGNGAPLVPYVDALLFASPAEDVVALNLGGIANVTVLPRGAAASMVRAWDTGPANMLIDAFVRRRTDGAEHFDRDGAYAASGAPDAAIVAKLTASEAPYLAQAPPKSTGRELFNTDYVMKLVARARADGAGDEDIIATAVQLTAESVGDAYRRFIVEPVREVLVSGGGAKNPVLFAAIEKAAAPIGVRHFDEVYFDGEAKEAVAFALLGYLHVMKRPGNVPTATGARGQRILGKLTPA